MKISLSLSSSGKLWLQTLSPACTPILSVVFARNESKHAVNILIHFIVSIFPNFYRYHDYIIVMNLSGHVDCVMKVCYCDIFSHLLLWTGSESNQIHSLCCSIHFLLRQIWSKHAKEANLTELTLYLSTSDLFDVFSSIISITIFSHTYYLASVNFVLICFDETTLYSKFTFA